MRPAALRLSIRRRRGAVVLATSAAAHMAVLAAFALHQPRAIAPTALPAMTVSLAPAPVFVRPRSAATAPRPRPTQARVVCVDAVAPRYAASAQAATGDATDAVDLFGPVFADGLWPRPVRVASAPCDPHDMSERGLACRRDLMLIGLASDAAARSKAGP
jgi:hypothetical protein